MIIGIKNLTATYKIYATRVFKFLLVYLDIPFFIFTNILPLKNNKFLLQETYELIMFWNKLSLTKAIQHKLSPENALTVNLLFLMYQLMGS